MKKVNYLWICVLSIMFVLLNSDLKSQTTYDPLFGHHCDDNLSQYLISSKMSSNTFGGVYKPERTNSYPGTSNSSVFRVLIVFVQFPNDTIDVHNPNWDTSGPPSYMNSLLAETKNTNYGNEWWNAYSESNQKISDYWMEVSRGNMHMVGNSYYVKLSHPWWWYGSNGSLAQVNSEIYDSLNNKPGLVWTNYDNWTLKDNTFKYEKDGQIDMMYVVHRGWRNNGITPGSIAMLYNSTQGGNHVVSSGDTIVAGFGADGSGCTFTPGAPGGGIVSPFSVDALPGLICHELGHYHFGAGHSNYGVMMGQGAIYGLDCRHSPWETTKLGYITTKDVNYSTTNYTLNDYSSRTSTAEGEILKVPFDGTNEYFLLALRNKGSKYDRIMLGDTAHDNAYRVINPEYGKGLYIYHINGGYAWGCSIDQECADGLFYWHQNGTFIPDWVNPNSPTQVLPLNVKDSVSYNNDVSTGGYNNVDEKSLNNGNWGGIGKNNSVLYGDGTDRIFTNESGVWTSRSWKGDRWDSWRPGYNEVFSPYSSPNTNSWGNDKGDIFIYLSGASGDSANIKVYKVGQGGYSTEWDILMATPPSRPMGLKHDYFYPTNGWCHPQITWNHNMEPDMERGTKSKYKRYLVYRTTAPNMSTIPDENGYIQIAQVDIPINVKPHYEDTSVLEYQCADLDQVPPFGTEYPLRYRVVAVDITEWASVKSNFVSTTGITPNVGICGEESDNPVFNSETPKEFNLTQNYPNPFNPMTKINFALPKQGFVTLKIYDITGREIQTLVSEVKQAGYYSVDFNGSALSSGVYFYRIQSNDFNMTKRMVLIK